MTNFLKMSLGEMCRTKAGTLAFVALAGTAAFVGSEVGRLIAGEKTKTESVFDYAKNEYNTYKEIKSEGIKAASYEEAKQKLDSIKQDRLFRKYGIVPPAENASPSQRLIKQLELQNKQNEDIENSLNDVINTVNMCPTVK